MPADIDVPATRRLLERIADGCDGTNGAEDDDRVFADGVVLRMRDLGLLRTLAARLDPLVAAERDRERLDWLQDAHRGIEAGTMDDETGEPTRKLFVVDGAGPDALMHDVRDAIDRARERYP